MNRRDRLRREKRVGLQVRRSCRRFFNRWRETRLAGTVMASDDRTAAFAFRLVRQHGAAVRALATVNLCFNRVRVNENERKGKR